MSGARVFCVSSATVNRSQLFTLVKICLFFTSLITVTTMKTFLVVSSLVTVLVDSHPYYDKKLTELIESEPCIKKCMDVLKQSNTELSIMKTVDFASYVLNLENICLIANEARDCIAACETGSNPFDLRSMTVMCNPEVRGEAQKYEGCMKKHGQNVLLACERRCGNMKNVSDEIDTRTVDFNGDKNPDPDKFSAVMQKTNEGCSIMKCFARCSRVMYSQHCNGITDDAGEFLYRFIDRVNRAMLVDLEDHRLTERMAQAMPLQCNYMYTPNVLFNKTADDLFLIEIEKQFIENQNAEYGEHHHHSPHQIPALQSIQQENMELQQKILIKELQLLDKREEVLEKESRKLDFEIEAIAKRGGF